MDVSVKPEGAKVLQTTRKQPKISERKNTYRDLTTQGRLTGEGRSSMIGVKEFLLGSGRRLNIWRRVQVVQRKGKDGEAEETFSKEKGGEGVGGQEGWRLRRNLRKGKLGIYGNFGKTLRMQIGSLKMRGRFKQRKAREHRPLDPGGLNLGP